MSGRALLIIFSVIQELGREGILPLSAFFATNKPFGAPLAALSVLTILSVIMVVAPPPGDAYTFLLSGRCSCIYINNHALKAAVSSYSLTLINTLVSTGLLLLHTPAYKIWGWNPPFRAPKPVVVLFFLSNVFLALTPLIPPAPNSRPFENIPYYVRRSALSLFFSLIGE